MAWLSGWNYRKLHIIGGSTNIQSNYQVKVKVHRTAGGDSGEDVYVGTKCRADFGDIRFTKSDEVTLLDYWLEEYNGGIATFWVEIDSIPASPSTVTIYVYYGKSDEATTSNGGNTFLLFDDFANLDDWDVIGATWSIEGGAAKCIGAGGDWASSTLRHKTFAATTEQAIRSRLKTVDGTNVGVYPNFGDTAHLVIGYLQTVDRLYMSANIGGAWDEVWGAFTWSQGTYYVVEVREPTANNFKAVAGATSVSNSVGAVAGNCALRGCSTNTTVSYFDWVLVRKYVEPEPPHGSWGEEESPVVPRPGFVNFQDPGIV